MARIAHVSYSTRRLPYERLLLVLGSAVAWVAIVLAAKALF